LAQSYIIESMNKKFWWLTGAALVGMSSTLWQIIEKVSLLKNPKVALSCNFNSTFNCSDVLNAHQSSIFGPPNAAIGLAVFSFFLAIGIAGLTGSKFVRKFALAIQGLALFMLGFTLWFLFESTYRIHAVCIFCLFIGTSVLVINAVMLRHNFGERIKRWSIRGADLFGWALVWLIVAFAMLLKFA